VSGICGVVNFDGAPVDTALLRRMTAAAPYRGPDGVRHWVDGNAGLAHQAFHVTPESVRERQPLASADGRFTLVADARIDNREELIRALRGGGLPLEPTDADLILAAYQRWREACAERLLGDFVVAVWDKADQKLFLARDALGARSACYHFDGRRCLIASEVRQILDVPGFQARINEGKVADYLASLNDDRAETLFESIYYFPPAHTVTISKAGVYKHRFWDIDPEARIRYRDDREYAEHFLALVTAATRCRMRSIGPIGLSLSGGLDSTLVAAVASKLLPEATFPQARLKSFSNVFDHLKSCDERDYIGPVVERLDLDATYLPCDDRWTLKDLPHWPVERDWIWADPYALLPAAVAVAARDAGCRVLLDGHYGDILFLGGRYWAADLVKEGRWKDLGRAMRDHRRDIRWRADLLDHGLRQLVPAGFKHLLRRVVPRPLPQRNPSFHPAIAERVNLRASAVEDDRSRRYTAPGQWVRLTALTDSSWAEGSGEAKRYYNRHQLEVESPYHDRRLVEYVMALPADQLGRPWRSRWMQRNAMTGLLPDAVCERTSKTAFDPLVTRGLLERERETVRTILGPARSAERSFVRRDWFEQALVKDRFTAEDIDQLWLIIGLELWLGRQNDFACADTTTSAWNNRR
jgi:asparagine synthase (glutamine-hydrolysing)